MQSLRFYENYSFKTKIKILTFNLLKLIFKVLCILLLIYQLNEITYDYLSFPFEVNLNINNENDIELPSITFCFEKNQITIH